MSIRNPITLSPFSVRKRRASVFIFSILLITIAGTSVAAWLSFVTHVQRESARDRARLQAFYAAEAGVDCVVDFFNNPSNYKGLIPSAYIDNGWDISPYGSAWDGAPASYSMFAPYILEVDRDNDDNVMSDADGHVVITRSTFLREQNNNLSSKIPTCQLDFSNQDDTTFFDSGGSEIARVDSVILINPSDFQAIENETPPAGEKILCKVISKGTTPQGVSVTVETLLRENLFAGFGAHTAIITRDTFNWDGHFDVHWGEVWAEGNAELHSNFTSNGNGHMPSAIEDIWVKVRTESWLTQGGEYADGDTNEDGVLDGDGFSVSPPIGQYNEKQPFDMDLFTGGLSDSHEGESLAGVLMAVNSSHPAEPVVTATDREVRVAVEGELNSTWNDVLVVAMGGQGNGNSDGGSADYSDYTNLYQQQDLAWPSYDYETVKEWFLDNGLPYFVMDTEGNIWGENEYGEWVVDTYEDWFHADHTDLDTYWNGQDIYAFIDTVPVDVDGNPFPFGIEEFTPFGEYTSYNPHDQNALVATLDIPSEIHSRGAMFIAAEVTGRGQGNVVNASNITDIDGNPYFTMPNYQEPSYRDLPNGNNSDRIFHNGLFYVYGSITFGGNRGVYGSVYAEDGYKGNGTVGVFYNYRLKDGSWLNSNQSVVLRDYWRVRSEELPEVPMANPGA